MSSKLLPVKLMCSAAISALLVLGVSGIAQSAPALSDQSAAHAPKLLPNNRLFIGTNYQPVDRTPAEIRNDIAMMKAAGFTIVRMGDLAWDSFEPVEDKFEFAWFTDILDQMHNAGIQVVLDIGGLPAPTWLHYKYPGVTIVTQEGDRLDPAERYHDNISDPDYQRRAKIYAEAFLKEYARHPAVVAIGYNNEIGNGVMSYSEADRLRFISWLKDKYQTLDALNKAWATQRWSRRISDWDQIRLPYREGPAPAERFLDLHRYWSDVTISVLEDQEALRRKYVPEKPSVSNFFSYAERFSFNYSASYRKYATYGGIGFYPGEIATTTYKALLNRGGLDTPLWFNEFTPGGWGGGIGNYGVKGKPRMWAHFGLINGVQTILVWTFNTHRGAEEQALFGLLNHDNTPSWKYDEFARVAGEFKTLEKLGFPRQMKPEVALAYSYDSRIASAPPGPTNTVRRYLRTPYIDQGYAAFRPLLNDNIDTAIIDLAHEDLSPYKLIIIPGQYVMDEPTAKAIRGFVQNGGTVIMTAYSAKVDETSQWFNTPLPGRLSDVFGLKTNEFYDLGKTALEVSFGDTTLKATNNFYEVLEPSTAKVLATFTNTAEKSPAITVNDYGKGKAIYLATPAQPALLQPLLHSLYEPLKIARGPETPEGVYARTVNGRTLYVNSTDTPQVINIQGKKKGVLSGKTYETSLTLEPLDVDLLE